MHFTPAGFFPKYVWQRPAWLADPRVTAIRSVSSCISSGPEDWISAWRHNDLGFYDSPDTAAEIAAALPPDPEGTLEIHGYRVADRAFDETEEGPADLAPVAADDIPAGWERLGYDAVSTGSTGFFECSPLTCNGRAPDFAVNEHGLLDTAEAARDAARSFSGGGAEPGTYTVFEVWRRPGA